MSKIKIIFLIVVLMFMADKAQCEDISEICTQEYVSMFEKQDDLDMMLSYWESLSPKCKGTGVYEYRLGQLFLMKREYEKSSMAFNEGLKYSTSWDRDISLAKGYIFMYKEEYSLAEKHYRNVIEKYPEWNEGYHSLGFSLFAQGSYQEAAAILEKANSLQKKAMTYRHLVLCYYSLGLFEKSVAALKMSSKLDASILKDKDPMIYGARAAAEQGDYRLSKKLLILLLGFIPEIINDDDYIDAGLFLQKKMELAGMTFK